MTLPATAPPNKDAVFLNVPLREMAPSLQTESDVTAAGVRVAKKKMERRIMLVIDDFGKNTFRRDELDPSEWDLWFLYPLSDAHGVQQREDILLVRT